MKIIRREKLASEKGSTLSLRPAENKKHNSKIKKKKNSRLSCIVYLSSLYPKQQQQQQQNQKRLD